MKQIVFLIFVTALFSCSSTPKEKTENAKEAEYIHSRQQLDSTKDIVCFVYHRFGDSRFPSTNISVNDFESQLKWLQSNNFQVLTLTDAISYLESNKPPQKTVVITIDDAFKSFFENGLPLLRKYDMPATLFVNTETVGARDYLDWSEIKQASSNRIEIGNHSHSHAYFLNKSKETRAKAFLEDIEIAQKLLEDNLNFTPLTFAFPYGEYDDEMLAIVKQLGFSVAAAQYSGVISSSSDPFQLPRFPMSEAYSKTFENKAMMKALVIKSKSPVSSINSNESVQPSLSLTLNVSGLKMDQVQCFVQGSECNLRIVEHVGNEMKLTIRSSASIGNRRRTLYTITVPDEEGQWHWFSHLWINPSIK